MSKVATRSSKEKKRNWILGYGKNYELMEVIVFSKLE